MNATPAPGSAHAVYRAQIWAALDSIRDAGSPCWQVVCNTIYGHWDITITRTLSITENGQNHCAVFVWAAKDDTANGLNEAREYATPEAAWNAGINVITYFVASAYKFDRAPQR